MPINAENIWTLLHMTDLSGYSQSISCRSPGHCPTPAVAPGMLWNPGGLKTCSFWAAVSMWKNRNRLFFFFCLPRCYDCIDLLCISILINYVLFRVIPIWLIQWESLDIWLSHANIDNIDSRCFSHCPIRSLKVCFKLFLPRWPSNLAHRTRTPRCCESFWRSSSCQLALIVIFGTRMGWLFVIICHNIIW